MATSPIGLHRVLSPPGVLPQAAEKLDNRVEIGADEVRISVERLNLDAASFRQLSSVYDPAGVKQAVLGIVGARGKMQNPVTGSGGMLIGTVEEVGPSSPLGLRVGDRVATLVSLTLTPLSITDGLKNWDGRSEQVPCEGHAILFARSIAAVLPSDLPPSLALAVLDVCGAPALTARVVSSYLRDPHPVRSQSVAQSETSRDVDQPREISVAVIGAAGKSGSLSCAAARKAGATRVVGVVPNQAEHDLLATTGLADEVVIADARNPVALASSLNTPVDVTVVCVDVPGCEHGAILATAQGGTVIFFSMATNFSAAALGAEGLAADVTMLIGNGYLPGHADYALGLLRTNSAVRSLFEARLAAD
ncbi:MAG TPA: L-erythro-3,5-diaminohexanoate dehydrogenase [Micromonosporaceae bacterium]|nr:L-erythro-3,5-diaminohexanoate dehydrogenase [Micromonosporaceae bacterium]